MKELTTQEKAKAYDEAIKKVNDYYEGKTKLYSDVDKTLNYLFPELKESEDESIRNVLIDYFNRYKEQEECGIKTFYGIPTDNILAWLEKQGNHKPTDNQFTSEQASLLDKHIEKLHNRNIKRVNQHVTVRPRHILL